MPVYPDALGNTNSKCYVFEWKQRFSKFTEGMKMALAYTGKYAAKMLQDKRKSS